MSNWSTNGPKRWLPLDIDPDDVPSQKQAIHDMVQSMVRNNMDPEIAELVAREILDTTSATQNTIFIFTENDYVITGIHVPYEAIGSDGPVLMRGASDQSIIAAFSRNKIIEMIEKLEHDEVNMEELSVDDQERVWVEKLEDLAQLVRLEMSVNPPSSWDDFFTEGES